jgi:hypothetical protein
LVSGEAIIIKRRNRFLKGKERPLSVIACTHTHTNFRPRKDLTHTLIDYDS